VKLEEPTLSSLLSSENIEKAWDNGLRKDHFLSPVNQGIFNFIQQYWLDSDRKLAPTIDVLLHEFPSLTVVQSEESLDWLIEKLKQRMKYNAVSEMLEKGAELASEDNVDGALHLLTTMSWTVSQLTQNRNSVSDFSTNIEDREFRYEERALFTGDVKGASLGLDEIDKHTFGVLPGEICVVAAFAGVGKTWQLILSAIGSRLRGFTPYFATLELSREDVEDRIDALISDVPHEAITRGELTKEQVDALRIARRDFAALGKFVIESPAEDERTVIAIVNKARQAGCDVVIIDQLSFMNGRKDYYKTPTEKITEILGDLHVEIGAAGRKLPVIIAVQINREGQKSGKPEAHHFADSSSIERIADQAFYLLQSNEMRANNSMEIGMLKFRRGSRHQWMLDWMLTKEHTSIVVDNEVDMSDSDG
jgi:replicative DNA helicase